MPRYERLQEDQRGKRRTIADAIEVLHSNGVFDAARTGEIRVGALQLPSQEIVGLVSAFVESAADETISIVSLPTSAQLRAKRQGNAELETFAIFQLDGATFDSSCSVELLDGTRLSAVEVIPSLLPYDVTDLDWRIVHHSIAFIRAEQECYRSPIPGWPPALDCSTLPALKGRIPLLKQIQGHIADRELKSPSEQQIANTLRKFGMRTPIARPRRARRPRAAPAS